jgi:hypothetical protein
MVNGKGSKMWTTNAVISFSAPRVKGRGSENSRRFATKVRNLVNRVLFLPPNQGSQTRNSAMLRRSQRVPQTRTELEVVYVYERLSAYLYVACLTVR